MLYLVSSTPLIPYLGQAAAAIAAVPIGAAGALFGLRAGIVAGVIGAVVAAAQFVPFGLMDLPRWPQVVVGVVGFAAIGAITGHVRDLSERLREQTARLERELEQRQRYTEVVAHELRNPLVAIRAAARVAQRDSSEPPVAERLGAIAEEAARSLGLLDGLSDLSSIESGRMRSVLLPVDIVATVHEAIRGSDAADRVRLTAPASQLLVRADARRIEQVIANLVSNAAKYSSPRSPIEVTVGVSPDVRCAVVQVRDHGPGIPPAERGRLFGKFARLSTAGGTTGTGLGLYISRGIIADHSGDLGATWPPGGGTEFSFTLPLTVDRRSTPR